MALDYSTNPAFTGRITAPSAAYPQGSSKDESSPGAGDGTPYIAQRANDIFGMQQALLRAAGITPTGSADTAIASEYLQALVELAAGRASWYDDSGAADAYELSARTNQQTPASLFDGLELKFFPDNDNTGASTIDPFTFGAVDVKLPGGSTDPAALDILAGVQTTVVYRLLPSAHFELRDAPSLTGGLGVNQTWQDVTGSRSLVTTFTNTTGKTIAVLVTLTSGPGAPSIIVDALVIGVTDTNATATTFFLVPAGSTYSISTGDALSIWSELR